MVAIDPALHARQKLRSPEKSFLASILLEAWNDLDRHDKTDRYESVQFFLSNTPARRAWRRELCALLDINEHALQRIVRAKIDELPERPDPPKKHITPDEFAALLPDEPFRAMDIVKLDPARLRYQTVTAHFHKLKNAGVIERIGHGLYARADWLARERAELFAVLKDDEAA